MKIKDTEKTSSFVGVSKRRGRWRAQYKPAGFERYFDTEMEAAAHYLWVYCTHVNGRPGCGDLITNILLKNVAWKGRTPIDELKHALGDSKYQFPIDKAHKVLVGSEDYTVFKDNYWFVRANRVTAIISCKQVDGEFQFGYHYLDSEIFALKVNGRAWGQLQPRYIDGNPFNLNRDNLDIPKEASFPLGEIVIQHQTSGPKARWFDDPLSWPEELREEADEDRD
jgi:hypothetical protein